MHFQSSRGAQARPRLKVPLQGPRLNVVRGHIMIPRSRKLTPIAANPVAANRKFVRVTWPEPNPKPMRFPIQLPLAHLFLN